MPHQIGTFILAMLAYIAAGKLGLMLSIPPGFASAVWPASGVALALALRFPLGAALLGTACGSLVINLSIATAQFSQISLQAILIAQGIATAAFLQTWAGHVLFKRYIQDISLLIEPIKQLRFLFQVSSLGCLTSCTLSSLTLWISGSIDSTQFIYPDAYSAFINSVDDYNQARVRA